MHLLVAILENVSLVGIAVLVLLSPALLATRTTRRWYGLTSAALSNLFIATLFIGSIYATFTLYGGGFSGTIMVVIGLVLGGAGVIFAALWQFLHFRMWSEIWWTLALAGTAVLTRFVLPALAFRGGIRDDSA